MLKSFYSNYKIILYKIGYINAFQYTSFTVQSNISHMGGSKNCEWGYGGLRN